MTVSQLEHPTCFQVIDVYINFVEADSRIREIIGVGHGVLEFKTPVANLTTQIDQIRKARLVNLLFKSWMAHISDICDLGYKTQATVTTHQQLKSLVLSIFLLLNGLMVY